MKQRLPLLLGVFFTSLSMQAQVADSLRSLHEDNSAFTFSESQLNEDDDANQNVISVMSSHDDIFLNTAGYSFSPMRFSVRGFDSQYNDVYINGIRFNNAEMGRFNFGGMLGGLNDATRNLDGVIGLNPSSFAFGEVGGETNYQMRASQFSPGQKISLMGSNRNYKLRGMYTISRALRNGYSFTFSTSYRWADEGYVDGTFYNAFAYFLSLEKVFNAHHSLSLTAWGAPTERAQQSAMTEEVRQLVGNSNRYNSYWGWQNGNKRSSRVVNDFEPSAVLSHTWTINRNNKLVTGLGFRYTNYKSNRLGWNYDSKDPRPDYYKYLPSYDETNLAGWQNGSARQIDWNAMYQANYNANNEGHAGYYNMEDRHNDQLYFSLNSTLNSQIKRDTHLSAGIDLSSTKGMHYKKLSDLMGANYFYDIDKYAEQDYGLDSQEEQNNVDNAGLKLKKGDKFGYDYNLFVQKASVWGQLTDKSLNHFSFSASGKVGITNMWRDGLMRNGRAAKGNASKGKSSTKDFLDVAGKLSTTWAINGNHSFTINGMIEQRAPLAYNAFLNPQIRNAYINDLSPEIIYGGDLTYRFKSGVLSGRFTGYYNVFDNKTEIENYFDDNVGTYVFQSLTGERKVHKGIEAAVAVKITSNLTLTGVAAIGDYTYDNNPTTTQSYENSSKEYDLKDIVYCKGYHVSGTPQKAYSLALDYNLKGWFFSVNGNYYCDNYLDFAPIRRIAANASIDSNGDYVNTQEKLDNGILMDASIGKNIRLKGGKSLSINLMVNNVLNRDDMRTGGFEQNRIDGTKYKPYYYYMQGTNGFVTVGLRF
jgi:hypothetical protein